MKKFFKKAAIAGATLTVMLPISAMATNGYFAHGYGTKNKGLAGGGVELQPGENCVYIPGGPSLVDDEVNEEPWQLGYELYWTSPGIDPQLSVTIDPFDEIDENDETNAYWDRRTRVGEVDNVQELVEHINNEQQVAALFSQLTAREASIMRYRFGLEGDGYHSLQETGQRVSLTRERVRQIERRCLQKMRRYATRHADQFTRTFEPSVAIAN